MGEHRSGAVLQAMAEPSEEFLSRVGHMIRAPRESLRGLGLDKLIEKAASDIPDARNRLDHVARLSEDAAQRVLNATDAASPLQGEIAAGARQLGARLIDFAPGQMRRERENNLLNGPRSTRPARVW